MYVSTFIKILKTSTSFWPLFPGRSKRVNMNKNIYSRWFKVTFLSPSWRSLSHWRGHLTIPKRSSQRIARLPRNLTWNPEFMTISKRRENLLFQKTSFTGSMWKFLGCKNQHPDHFFDTNTHTHTSIFSLLLDTFYLLCRVSHLRRKKIWSDKSSKTGKKTRSLTFPRRPKSSKYPWGRKCLEPGGVWMSWVWTSRISTPLRGEGKKS